MQFKFKRFMYVTCLSMGLASAGATDLNCSGLSDQAAYIRATDYAKNYPQVLPSLPLVLGYSINLYLTGAPAPGQKVYYELVDLVQHSVIVPKTQVSNNSIELKQNFSDELVIYPQPVMPISRQRQYRLIISGLNYAGNSISSIYDFGLAYTNLQYKDTGLKSTSPEFPIYGLYGNFKYFTKTHANSGISAYLEINPDFKAASCFINEHILISSSEIEWFISGNLNPQATLKLSGNIAYSPAYVSYTSAAVEHGEEFTWQGNKRINVETK